MAPGNWYEPTFPDLWRWQQVVTKTEVIGACSSPKKLELNAGVPESTIRSWVREKPDGEELELPSGKVFRVREILATDGNTYKVVLEFTSSGKKSLLLSFAV